MPARAGGRGNQTARERIDREPPSGASGRASASVAYVIQRWPRSGHPWQAREALVADAYSL